MYKVTFAVLAVAMAWGSGSAFAATKAPLGYQLLCLQNPQECKVSAAAVVDLSGAMARTVKSINVKVNRSIRPQRDSGADVWSVSASAGDCEDYVLAKRRALIAAGVPAGALRIAHVVTRRGTDHAVLVIRTSRGLFALDNLTSTIKPLSQTGYRVRAMQTSDPLKWA